MAEDVTVTHETVASSLTQLVDLGRVLLENAKKEAAVSLERFVPHKITTLFGLISPGAQLYKSIGVKDRSEAEAVCQKFYHHAEVREKLEELLELENEWNSFLDEVDKGLQTTDWLSGGKMADSLSPDVAFTDGRSEKSVTLGQFLEQGQKLLLVLIRHYG